MSHVVPSLISNNMDISYGIIVLFITPLKYRKLNLNKYKTLLKITHTLTIFGEHGIINHDD